MRRFPKSMVLLLALLIASPVLAVETAAPDAAAPAPAPEQAPEATPAPPPPDHDAGAFRWDTVAGAYLDPTSIFALHGYVNGVYASASPDWTAPDPTRPGPPGQLLVPPPNVASYHFDAGLVLSSQNSPRTSILMETHAVTDP